MSITWAPGYDAFPEAYSEKETYDIVKPPTADVKLRVAWNDRYAVLTYLLGNRVQWPYESVVPLIAVSGSVAPIPNVQNANDGGQGNVYLNAHLDVHFDPYAIFTESVSPHAEMLKVPAIGQPYYNEFNSPFEPGTSAIPVICWRHPDEDEGDPPTTDPEGTGRYSPVTPEEAPTKLIIGHDYTVKFEQLDTIPDEVLTMIDHVNDATVYSIDFTTDSGFLTFEPETLLLTAAHATHTVSVDGTTKNSLELHFSWRKEGWNRFWRKDSQDWEYMWFVVTGQPADTLDTKSFIGPITTTITDPFTDEESELLVGPPPVLYRNFPMGDFSNLLPTS